MSATEARASSFFCLRFIRLSEHDVLTQLHWLQSSCESLSIWDDPACKNTLALASKRGTIIEHHACLAVASSRHCSDRGSRQRSLSAHVRGCQPWLAATW